MKVRFVVAVILASVVMAGCATPDDKPRAYKGEPISIEQVFRLAGITKQDVVADIAWEDGSAAVTAGKYGIKGWAYPDDVRGYFKANQMARAAGVADLVSVRMLRHDSSLQGANVIFYSPSPSFRDIDLGAAIKKGPSSGKIISTQKLRFPGIDLRVIAQSHGLILYRWGPEPSVRDTVPPPQDIVYPLPPKAAPPKPPTD